MDIVIVGAAGHLGTAVREALGAGAEDMRLVAGVDPLGGEGAGYPWYPSCREAPPSDLVIDASDHTAVGETIALARRNRAGLVVAATGHTAPERDALRRACAEIPVFMSANYALGATVLTEFARRLASLYPVGDIEIVEAHHAGKRDAPSGTAKALFEAIREARPRAEAKYGRCGTERRGADEIGLHALRMGALAGTHAVSLATEEEGLTLVHTAYTPRVFAKGILRAAAFLAGREAGFYTMSDLVYT